MSSAVHGDARLRASDAVVAWCVRNAERRLRLRDAEQAGIIAYVAAATAAELGHSWLCAAPLEHLLTAIGRTLPDASPLHRPARPRRWLHVLTISAPIGGHTALARRWIARNPGRLRHDVVLTAQAVRDADPALCRAAASSGGIVRSVSDVTSLLGRAAALRALAADVEAVVLHVHMWDVLPSLAFAAPGGPVVLLMNHADHAFWVGAAVADAVVDFRDSGLALTQRLRAARASRLLPVPLEERPAVAADRTALAGRVPADALARRTLLLTIGRGAKYQSHPSLDFPAAARRIVQGLGDCTLLAVGPSTDDALWRELSRATDGRALAVGEHADLAAWHAAADLDLEGFPVGSYTALLETGQAGRAVVRKPWLAPRDVLPVDDGALAAAPPPMDVDHYVAQALRLAHDTAARSAQVATLRAAVVACHAGGAWDARLRALESELPATHGPGLAGEPPAMPPALRAYVAGVNAARTATAPLAFAEAAALAQGVRLRRDVALLDALHAVSTTSSVEAERGVTP
jgi:hypothetical protein